jgi:hypothetical protein
MFTNSIIIYIQNEKNIYLESVKLLSKVEQKQIKGGHNIYCIDDKSCPEGMGCDPFHVCRIKPLV